MSSRPKAPLRCEAHPHYQGKSEPRSDCPTCQKIWLKEHGSIGDQIAEDIADIRESAEMQVLKRKYQKLLRNNVALQRQVQAALEIKDYVLRPGLKIKPIRPLHSQHISEATAFMLMGDWHYEEPVDPETVNGLNESSIATKDRQIYYLFKNGLKVLQKEQRDVKIHELVLALLGDFISNDIHDELMQANEILPVEACKIVTMKLIEGIEFLLEHSDCNLTIICHSGNHGRTTKELRHSTEVGNSLESLIYFALDLYFRDNPKVKFIIAAGYHSYLPVYDKVIRFHHGHDIRYQGGVGGIYIPVNKAINQWNKGRKADLDVMGHWHQFRDGGNFIVNGSLLGYSAYALAIKADFELPRQGFFLWDKINGKTVVMPILLKDVKE